MIRTKEDAMLYVVKRTPERWDIDKFMYDLSKVTGNTYLTGRCASTFFKNASPISQDEIFQDAFKNRKDLNDIERLRNK